MDIKNNSLITRERFVLAVYVLYTIAMVAVAFVHHWDSWVIPVVVSLLLVSLAIHIGESRTLKFRAFIVIVSIWANVIIFTYNNADVIGALPTVSGVIVLLALYRIPEYTWISAAVYTCLIIAHFSIVRDIRLTESGENAQLIMRLASVYFVIFITYILQKAQALSDAKMQESIEEIRQAEGSKDDFMANMSHEIRTPINTVCGISEMVLRENLTDEARIGVYDIQTAGRQLLSLVSDILDFTELSSGKMEIVPDTYNITSTLNDILNMAVAKADGKGLEIIVDCDASIPSGLVGDEQKIRRAITNVVDNAVKFTDEGGIIITMSARRESYGINLVVTVRDTGIGIKEEDLDGLFSRFSMVDTKRNRNEGGMGLGLSIAKVITNKMGGFISVKSTYGEGTEVQLVFPQKVDSEIPVVSLEHPEKCSTVLYLNTQKYKSAVIRDGYTTNIRNMVAQLGMHYRHARSLTELKAFLEREEFNNVFISWEEYCEDKDFFEELSHRTKVVLILDRGHKDSVMGSKLLVVYKPFYVLTIASVLNGRYAEHLGRDAARFAKFVAPAASVLVVDDNLMNLKVVEGLLRPYRIKVFVAQSGQEALDKLETGRFDIVFMDHMMPEMDGIECFHRIKQKHGSYYQNVPIVALTANAIGGAREMFLSEGFADYVAKPIELSALERVLYKFIPDDKLEKEDIDHSAVESEPIDDDTSAPSDSEFDIEGIDVNVGIGYCGGRFDDYAEVVRAYYSIGAAKAADIRNAYETQNWKYYTTLVHAVKSTSLGIGATELGEMAKELEAAGKREDAEFIEGYNQTMLAEYERILGAIAKSSAIFPDGAPKEDTGTDDVPADLEEIGAYALVEEFDKLSWLMDSFETEAVSEALDDLYNYMYNGEPVKKLLSGVSKLIDNFDFLSAKEELTKLRDEVRS